MGLVGFIPSLKSRILDLAAVIFSLVSEAGIGPAFLS